MPDLYTTLVSLQLSNSLGVKGNRPEQGISTQLKEGSWNGSNFSVTSPPRGQVIAHLDAVVVP